MQTPVTDINAHVKCVIAGSSQFAAVPANLIANGNGDNTKVTGHYIDRQGYDSMVLAIAAFANLDNAETLKFAVEMVESDDHSSWSTPAEVVQASTTLLTATSATVFQGCTQIAVDLKSRKRYVRFDITPNLSRAGTDIANWHAVAVLGGAQILPAV